MRIRRGSSNQARGAAALVSGDLVLHQKARFVYSTANSNFQLQSPVANGSSGSGTVTHTGGALTLNQLVFGNAAADVAVGDLTGDITTSGGKATTLASVATAGTGTKVTINAKGLSTSVANASLASADFANQGTTTTVLHGNAAGNPSFGAIALGAEVSGNLA